jgi:tRNA pseudouridine55 synthase
VDGTLLVNKHAGVSSFGVIEQLQGVLMKHPGAYGVSTPFARRRDLPKLGHGGTLDPFATGLLAVCVGRGVKLARYFLGSGKTYEGIIRFGETTIPGDPTDPISERCGVLPSSTEQIQAAAHAFTQGPYSQTPPMHSAKKKDGKPLYELARQGIEIERVAKQLTIHSFEILAFESPRATFRVRASSGTYVRTLAQDLGKRLGTVAMLDTLHRVESGIHRLVGPGDARAMSVEEIAQASAEGKRWDELSAWVPFDRLLDGYARAEATAEDALSLIHGKQGVLPQILKGIQPQSEPVVIFHEQRIVAIARMDNGVWGLERVFTHDTESSEAGPGQSQSSRAHDSALGV